MAYGQFLNFPAARAYIWDTDFDSLVVKIIDKFHLPGERLDELLDLCRGVFDKIITVAEMPSLLEQAFGIDNEKAKAISADLAGYIMLPLVNYLPGIDKDIEALGGKLGDYPDTRVPRDKAAQVDTLKEIVNFLELNLDDVLLKRLRFLLDQYVNKKKDEAFLKSFFTRSDNVGGLNLKEDQADALLRVVLPIASTLVQRITPSVAPVKPPEVQGKKELEVAPSHELMIQPGLKSAHPEHVIQRHQAQQAQPKVPVTPVQTKPQPVAKPAPRPAVPIVSKPTVLAPPKLPQPSVPVTKPVAKPAPVAPVVVQAPVVAAAQVVKAEPVVETVAVKKAQALKPLVESVNTKLQAAVKVALEIASPILQKAKISEKVFADMAEKVFKGVRDAYQARDLVEKDWALKGSDLTVFMQAINKGLETYNQSIKPVVPVVKSSDRPVVKKMHTLVSAARTEKDELALQVERMRAKMQKTATGSGEPKTSPPLAAPAPAPAKAELTVGSVSIQATQTPTGHRPVVDIINANRLSGPIEQLGSMSLAEFRRLSSNPTEAVQKIEDLLSTLETTSYDERVKGVLAWRDSPINQAYLQMAEEALAQGVALSEISARKRTQGKESLSLAEIKAIALLNGRIRF